MPVMDGIQFLRERNRDPEIAKIPVIMLTGSAELEGREQELNFQGFVRKPFVPDDLTRQFRGTDEPKPWDGIEQACHRRALQHLGQFGFQGFDFLM